ncbi:hypothetical protein DFH11DRAFT_1508158 [Phellopilus nigrolimitatus]|nr:hypothetical protein DFH11DRAFT_1508158 [Phellopilus nigrolimitatus]
MSLFALPTELLIAILTYLDVRDILAFCRVCRFTHNVHSDSTLLRYIVALAAAGMEDAGVFYPLETSRRLSYLLGREALWSRVDLNEERRFTIPVNHRNSHIHDLTAGVYIFGDLSLVPDSLRTNSLRYVYLPVCMHRHEMEVSNWWKRVPLGQGVEALNIGVSLRENDLLVVLTSVPIMNAGTVHIFQLHMKEFSTAEPHPLAREPVIHFHEHQEQEAPCVATIEMAGPHVLVLLTWLGSPDLLDELYVYDWKTGKQISHISSRNSTYRGTAFLSFDTFILTNMRENAIELFKLKKEGTDEEVMHCRRIGKLELPTLKPGSSLVSVSCRTDAIRSGKRSSSASSASSEYIVANQNRGAPMHCAPDEALVHFRMYLQGPDVQNADHVSLFTFVAHRGELLRAVRSDGTMAKPWRAWGPKVTRWSGCDELDTAWLAGIAGQRQVFLAGEGPRHIHVRDYNAVAVRKALADNRRGANQRQMRLVTEESVTAHEDCFSEDVRSALPFVEISSEQKFNYDAVLMDEEHIIGLTEDEDDGSVRQLDVYMMIPEDARTCNCE